MTPKRLFIFAAYDPDGTIDASVLLYVQALAQMGDVVFYMDSDASADELAKVKPFVLFADAARHGEYDFGSYKRGYLIARDAGILKNYTHVYLANDSMYAPMHPIQPLIEALEVKGTNATGMVFNVHRTHPHIQSWFIGMDRSIFLSDWFDAFMTSVTKLPGKGEVTRAYEHGFTTHLIEHNLSWACAFYVRRHAIYNDIKRLFRDGLPFMKKISFVRKHGALGRQIRYVLNAIDPTMRAAIIENAERTHGAASVQNLLTNNPFKIVYRHIKHTLYKLVIEGV